MNDNNDPDSPLSPAQPAEEIPDWVKAQMPEAERFSVSPLPAEPQADPDGEPAESDGVGGPRRAKAGQGGPNARTPERPNARTPVHLRRPPVSPLLGRPPQPKAVTLAEKHKARRQTSRRLLFQAGDSEPVINGGLQSSAAQEAPVEAQYERTPAKGGLTEETQNLVSDPQYLVSNVGMAQAANGSSVAAPPQNAFLQKVRAYAQRTWPRMRPYLWRGRVAPAFWTVASVFSLVVNIILVVALILLGRPLFFLKKTVVSEKLINGLYYNFVLMDKAHIQTTITVSDTIQVNDTIPVVFDLVLSQKTVVTLTDSTPIKGATIYLNGQAVPLDLVLPQGTKLGIQMNLTVPVKQEVPVVLNVPVNLQIPVDIPLDQTQLHQPFVGLQQVLSPFRQLLSDVPDSWSEVCKGSLKPFCVLLRFK